MRLVKCRICGNKIDQKIAYKVTNNGKNSYYCNEKEYTSYIENENCKKKVIDLVRTMLTSVNCWSAVNKEISQLVTQYPTEKVYDCLNENEQYIDGVLRRKHFESDYGKMRYFFAIIKNKLLEYKWQPTQERVPIEVQSDFQINYKYKPKTNRKALIDIELDLEDEEY